MSQALGWKQILEQALRSNKLVFHSRFMQLATVQESGLPANRTVVFRGFYKQSGTITMITDKRSEKIQQLKQNPAAEICWYFSESREQFRIAGSLVCIDNDQDEIKGQDLRQQHWANLPPMARSLFNWPEPGKVRGAEDDWRYQQAGKAIDKPNDNFCVLLLVPNKVDYLVLKGHPHSRHCYQLRQDGNWRCTEITP